MAIPIMAIMGGAMMGLGFAQMFPPVSRFMTYPQNRGWRNEIIGASEALLLWLRNEIDDEQLDFELASTGLNKDRVAWLKKTTHQLLNATELIRLYRRKEITSNEFYDRTSEVGWTKDRVDSLLTSTEVIPSATDIISFAVREIYTPEIAERFGQYEGADEVYNLAKDDIEAVGMREATFRNYWAAHWKLPSAEQGFEMLHRGAIEADDLDKLLVALDIMPYFRKPLTDIAYRPFTRVDVRRMYRVGVLAEADLPTAYTDLGYSKEKAAKMAEFTVKYESSPTEDEMTEDEKDAVKARELSRTDICRGYRLKLIKGDDARELLGLLGYDAEAADYYISREDYLEEEDRTDKYLKWFHDAYAKDIWDKTTVIAKLGELNLPSEYTDYLLEIWELEKEVKVNMATKGEVLGFLKKGIITRDICIAELRKLRYPDKYIGWYMAGAEAS